MKVAVVGAGIAGLWCAFLLTRKPDIQVTIFERYDAIGQGCSWYAGGMLAPFCEQDICPPEITQQGQEGLALWNYYHPELVYNTGSLVLAMPHNQADYLRMQRQTVGYQNYQEKDLCQFEPALAGRFQQALFYAQEGHILPRQALQVLADKFQQQGGCLRLQAPWQVRYGVDFDYVIDCRGLAAQDKLPQLRGLRGEMMIVHCQDVQLKTMVRLLHPRHPIYIVPRPDSHYMIGATMLESQSDDRRVSLKSAGILLTQAYNLHPAFGEALICEMNAAARPSLSDHLPCIRWDGKTAYVNGLYRHGYLLAPVLAQRLITNLGCC